MCREERCLGDAREQFSRGCAWHLDFGAGPPACLCRGQLCWLCSPLPGSDSQGALASSTGELTHNFNTCSCLSKSLSLLNYFVVSRDKVGLHLDLL